MNAVRWRKNILGPHNPFATRGLSWSRDETFWHTAPSGLSMDMRIYQPDQISDTEKQEIDEIVNNGLQEPVHHELFREAWDQRSGNPRSSLVTGVAALEVASKATISTLAPDASWLADNMPSPPVLKILNEYIPQLPVKNTIDGKVLPLPSRIHEVIKNAVSKRNRITHVGERPPTSGVLDQMLNAIRDVIWLLEYYSGHDWAYNHISKETKEALEE